jgi:hypothetical protein
VAELVCVYDLKPVPRTVADILPTHDGDRSADGANSTGGDQQAPSRAPKAAGKWLAASVTDDIPSVIAAGFDEATRCDPGHARDWVALVDGNCAQIDAITAEAATRGVKVTILIDWLHVAGYLWDAAKAFFCTDTTAGMDKARDWVHERSRMILQGDAGQVAERIRARVLDSKLTAAQRKSALEAATYLTNKAPHLNYPTALAKGWPIATGVVEGACRHLVKDRLEIGGARWGLDTAEAGRGPDRVRTRRGRHEPARGPAPLPGAPRPWPPGARRGSATSGPSCLPSRGCREGTPALHTATVPPPPRSQAARGDDVGSHASRRTAPRLQPTARPPPTGDTRPAAASMVSRLTAVAPVAV